MIRWSKNDLRKKGYIQTSFDGWSKNDDPNGRNSPQPKRGSRKKSLDHQQNETLFSPEGTQCYTILFLLYRVRPLDEDNPMVKWAVDAVRRWRWPNGLGIMPDDAPQYLRECSHKQIKVKTKSEERTTIIITRIA